MKSFLKTRLGLGCVATFTVVMAAMFYRVTHRAKAGAPPIVTVADRLQPSAPRQTQRAINPEPDRPPAATPDPQTSAIAENAAFLDQYYDLDQRTREDHDRQGNRVIRRENASTPAAASHIIDENDPPVPPPAVVRASSRLQGRPVGVRPSPATLGESPTGLLQVKLADATQRASDRVTAERPSVGAVAESSRKRPARFNPYGRVIKCELVFAIDSMSEDAPFVGLVMEPVYNNGSLIIPAGAELHGFVRPDRMRDRLLSRDDWVLVFPRDRERPNGRQLNVKGVALDRVEPDANGMTWGITDGSYGLQGQIIRTLEGEEIKRFAAAFLAGATTTLESREVSHDGHETVRNTPQNALLQGVSADLEQITRDISAEIQAHGTFIRVPAGHQFYFYPTQIIDPDVADISRNVASVQ